MYFIAFIIFLATIDQISKSIILKKTNNGNNVINFKNKLFFKVAHNDGLALNILSKRKFFIISIIMIAISIFLFVLFDPENQNNKLLKISITLIIGGGLGNLIDRFKFGYVIDFINFKIKRTPIFNLADLFIFIGAIIYITDYII